MARIQADEVGQVAVCRLAGGSAGPFEKVARLSDMQAVIEERKQAVDRAAIGRICGADAFGFLAAFLAVLLGALDRLIDCPPSA